MDKESREKILEVEEVGMVFGGLMALINIHFNAKEGMVKAIIGPNGAGKTTLFNIITGTFSPTEGVVRFRGKPIQKLKAHEIAELGISRTFQTIELFGNMTVLENVMVGCHPHSIIIYRIRPAVAPLQAQGGANSCKSDGNS